MIQFGVITKYLRNKFTKTFGTVGILGAFTIGTWVYSEIKPDLIFTFDNKSFKFIILNNTLQRFDRIETEAIISVKNNGFKSGYIDKVELIPDKYATTTPYILEADHVLVKWNETKLIKITAVFDVSHYSVGNVTHTVCLRFRDNKGQLIRQSGSESMFLTITFQGKSNPPPTSTKLLPSHA